MTLLKTLLDNYGWIVGLSGAGLGLVGWFLGGSSVLRILSSVIDIISPALKAIVEILVSGLRTILSSMTTIVTVAALVYGMHLYDKINATIKYNIVATRLSVCLDENAHLTKTTPEKDAPLWDFPITLPDWLRF